MAGLTALNRLFQSSLEESIEFYYGIEGKRAAVLRFLTAVRDAAFPSTLLLCAVMKRWNGCSGIGSFCSSGARSCGKY